MGIDGIGKPGGIGGAGGPAGPVSPKGEAFEVGKAAPADAAQGSDALGKLERGEIGVEEYLDGRVADAVRHLEAKLPAEQLELVRQTLREQLETDPVLVELVRRATASVKTE